MSEMCSKIHQLFAERPRWQFPFDVAKLPLNGIYILFEKGESGHGVDRIVRVGTHTGQNQLPSRLQQHFLKENKDRSIFRKNIGRAILNRDHDPFLAQWEIDLTPAGAKGKYGGTIDMHKLHNTEKRVTDYMQSNFNFAVVKVDDKEARLKWESRLISTVSACEECRPSPVWLGQFSPKVKIQKKGLWLVNELDKEPLTDGEFAKLKAATLKQA
ncbi:MAG: hypothetical protein HY326_01780 [Chloroflexi bacterium]|nr:hypothetical protein [Chloroflexota bacterium]